ncbi:MAG: PAS domain S-box protein [Rhodocyclaceae bacterium]|nr:PAS domain S-box protein [Rhodocyclaceae bacterium]
MLKKLLSADKPVRLALGVCGTYVAISLTWVLITDWALSSLVAPAQVQSDDRFKPFAFIAVSAALLFVFVTRFNRAAGAFRNKATSVAAAEPHPRGLPQNIALAVGTAVLLVLFNLIYSLNADRQERIKVAEESAQNLARAIDEHTAAMFKAVDLSLAAASRAYTEPAASTEERDQRAATQLLADLRALPYVKTLFIVDATGKIALSTDTNNGPPIKFASHSYFIEARDSQARQMLIGSPSESWITGAERFAVARGIDGANRQFMGIAVAVIESARLQSFYDTLRVGERGSISIARRDGTLLVRSPFTKGIVGSNFRDTFLFQNALPAAKTGTFTSDSQLDGIRKIFSYRELADWPVVVAVGFGEAEVLSAWVWSARTYSFISLGFALALIWLGWLLWRGLKQQDQFAQTTMQNEQRFRKLTELSSDWYWEQDTSFRYVLLSQNFSDRTGIAPSRVLGKTREELSTNDRDIQLTITAAQQAHQAFRDVTYRRIWPDGSEKWYQTSGAPVFDAVGVFTGYRGTTKDVTALMRAQQAIVESERRYRLMFDLNPHPMWVFDAESSGFLAVNQAACKQYGYSADEFMDMTIFDLHPPSELPRLKAALEKSPEERESGDWLHRRQDGGLITVRVIADNIQFFESPARLVLALDITELRQAETKILKFNSELEEHVGARTAELELMNRELESFSYSVAHDLRAPLRHINGYATLLQESSAKLPETTRRHLDIIAKAAEHMGNLIDAMLDLSRVSRVAVRLAPVDMNRLIHEVLIDGEREMGARTIHWSIDELPNVIGDVRLLRQVFINLVTNAVKFTARQANAAIEIGIDQQHRDQLRDGQVVIYVRDNGAGFDMAHSNKLFDAFQRLHTQAEFPGTGIGLATVSRIVERHGGRVWAEGQLGRGATFYVLLKVA